MPTLEDQANGTLTVRGAPSNVIKLKTGLPTKPGEMEPPRLLSASGGALTIQLTSPNDTGGIVIRGFNLYVDGELVDEDNDDMLFYESVERSDLQIDKKLLLGGLSSNRSYAFLAVAVNDVSSCGTDVPRSVEQLRYASQVFMTGAPSLAKPIREIVQLGTTGGGMEIMWEAPRDRGGGVDLLYQVYMSVSGSTPQWELVYNDSATSFWKSQLQNATSYLFKASSLNYVGYSNESMVFELTTADVSVPGPPGSIKMLSRTGGLIRLEWTPPEDNGGMEVTYYVVEANGVSTRLAMTQASVGGLLANTDYEITVFAGNFLGTGNVGVTAILSTGDVTIPSAPSAISVVSVSGGSATLSLVLPSDTGGATIDELVYVVYANGVLVPASSIKILRKPSTASAVDSPGDIQWHRRLSTPETRSRRLEDPLGGGSGLSDKALTAVVQVGGLLPLIDYGFTVSLSNDAGSSVVSAENSQKTAAASVPGTPDAPRAVTLTGGSATLTWADPVDTGGLPLTSYVLTVNFGKTFVQNCSGLVLSCLITQLDFLTEYTAVVSAVNLVGASPASEPVVFTTITATKPSAPQGLTASAVTQESVSLTWQLPADVGGGVVTSYTVDVFRLSDASRAVRSTVASDQTQTVVSGLSPLMDYFVTIVSIRVG
jgi:hypothetical protein